MSRRGQKKPAAKERQRPKVDSSSARVRATLTRVWHFLWHEDSIASWLANIVLAFILIKFLLYPALGLLLGTQFPVVAVVSSSMEHHPGDFQEWWGKNQDFYLARNITQFDFLTYPFKKGFNKGDIMLLAGVNASDVPHGAILVYWSGKPYPIIHRFVGYHTIENTTYLTSKGDNNPRQIVGSDLNEQRIPPQNVVGRAILRIPFLGWIKILAVNGYVCSFYGPGPGQSWGACLIDGQQAVSPLFSLGG